MFFMRKKMFQRILNRKKDCRCSYEAYELSFLTRREEEILIQILYISININKKLDIMHILLYIIYIY